MRASRSLIWKLLGGILLAAGFLGFVLDMFFGSAMWASLVIVYVGKVCCERGGGKDSLAPFLLLVIGAVIMVGGSLVLISRALTSGPLGIALSTSLVFLYIGRLCYIRGKKHQLATAEELMSRDSRRPVLYLRSFLDDTEASKMPVEFGSFFVLDTEEELLGKLMNKIGPLVAIGMPGEKLPQLGAARMYVSDEQWQERVQSLMEGASLVLLRLGQTKGFWWELQHAVLKVQPPRLVLIVPYEIEEYDRFRLKAQTYFPRPLPECPKPKRFQFRWAIGLGTVRGLMYFQQDWTPVYENLTLLRLPIDLRPFVRERTFVRKVSWALRPVITRLTAGTEVGPRKA